MDSLLPKPPLVPILRDAPHPIIKHVPRVRDGIAPERRRVDPEVPHRRPRDARERERDGAPVAVEARRVSVPRPPELAVADDPARAVRVDREVAAGDDEPGGLVLDEDDAVGVVGVQPVLDVWDELREVGSGDDE